MEDRINVSLTRDEAKVALESLRKTSAVATTDDPFAVEATTANFIIDTSGSMAATMSGAYSNDWAASKMASCHELMRTIMDESAVQVICIGRPPKELVDNGKAIMDEHNGVPDIWYGAWKADTIPVTGVGSTPLWAGLALGKNLGWDSVCVISDGLPQDERRALKEADRYTRIDAWFLGNGESWNAKEGRSFMERLHRGAGTFGSTNLGNEAVRRQLATKIAGYLPGYGVGG